MQPTLEALQQLGGSGHIDEIYDRVVAIGDFSQAELDQIHGDKAGAPTEIHYRLAWSRTYLKNAGYIVNSARGVWRLTDKGREVRDLDVQEVVKEAHANSTPSSPSQAETLADDSPHWKAQLLAVLTTEVAPDAFERLVGFILRESGFSDVTVTAASGDKGIDGIGYLKVNDFMSFKIAFQCKRYTGTVGSPAIRDFRGAVTGRADRGLFITTGRFTSDAMEEARRDGAMPVELIDGSALADKMRELSIGVQDRVYVDAQWLREEF